MTKNGFTLIEILVSLFLLSLALLGLLGVQVEALRVTRQAIHQDTAFSQLHNAQQMLMMRGLSGFNQAQWQQENAQDLPQGKGALQRSGRYEIIRLCWYEGHEICREERALL